MQQQNASITLGLPVGNLPEAIGWYRSVLGSRQTYQPLPHILEFELAKGVSLQLVDDPELSSGDGVMRLRVPDVDAERVRLWKAGLDVTEITRHAGKIAFLYLNDPWGNRLCLYQELAR